MCTINPANEDQNYADLIIEESERYGTALKYYARGHCWKRMRNVLDLLLSISLIRSDAFPPKSLLDSDLHSLIYERESSFEKLSALDRDAAAKLYGFMSGYASLRAFYDLRDSRLYSKSQERPAKSWHLRRTEAASKLCAVVISASDNIAGGLFDEHRQAAVQHDILLALLGEAMVLVKGKSVLGLSLDYCSAVVDFKLRPR